MHKQEKNRRILVIDDNESIHKDFREILETTHIDTATLDEAKAAILGDAAKAPEREGFEIDSAFQGVEGLEKVKKALAEDKPYAMAFVDIRMPPGWDGVETIQHLWAEYPELQVVICTAYSDYQWSDIIDKLGQTDQLLILKKPFDNVEVRQLACALTEKWALARQAEIALGESEEKYRKLFGEAMDAIFVADAETGILIDCNPAAARLVGREKTELIGQHQRILHPPEKIEKGFSKTFKQHVQQKRGRTLETQVITKDGQIKDVAIKANVFELGGKKVIQGTFRDITERKRAEEKLKEQDRLKTDFVVNVSHELRTPLTIFKNIISNALAGVMGQLNDKQRENFEIADKEIDRLARIVAEFLDIAKIESGKIKLELKQLDILSVITDVTGLLRALAKAKNAELETAIPRDSKLFVYADRDRMTQVLTNLMDNAVKFVPDHGGRITVRIRDLDDEVGIDIEDNGPGIEDDDINRVFNRFVQVEKHIGPGTHGIGLGLAICKELIELQGGRIWVENTPTGGANFCFTLPKYGVNSKDQHKAGTVLKQPADVSA